MKIVKGVQSVGIPGIKASHKGNTIRIAGEGKVSQDVFAGAVTADIKVGHKPEKLATSHIFPRGAKVNSQQLAKGLTRSINHAGATATVKQVAGQHTPKNHHDDVFEIRVKN